MPSILPSVRRRLRRRRTQARLSWHLHRQGIRKLSFWQLNSLYVTLQSHHSRDPVLLAKLRKEMEMDPWRCRYCMRLVTMPRFQLCASIQDFGLHWWLARPGVVGSGTMGCESTQVAQKAHTEPKTQSQATQCGGGQRQTQRGRKRFP